MIKPAFVDIAWKALTRNRLQTALTMIGVTVGVATVLAMMAVGAGAQRSIEQQVRAAGLNQIAVKAGNWKPKTDDSGSAIAHQGDASDTLVLPVPELVPLPPADSRLPTADDVVPASFHPEDDPMEKHDHPLAWQRLGDLEAGLGAAATLSFADAEAIRQLDGVQYVTVATGRSGSHAPGRLYTFALDAKTPIPSMDPVPPPLDPSGVSSTEMIAREFDRVGLPNEPGRVLVQQLCAGCHAPTVVTRFRLPEQGWRETMADMVNRGMAGTKAEHEIVLKYLMTYRGPESRQP